MSIHKSIGIWGFSRVGTAAARYYISQGLQPAIFDAQSLSPGQQSYCVQHALPVWQPDQLIPFLQTYDYILPSPGIDLRPYSAYAHKWLSEFDIFCHAYKKPIIGITGSIGKTSVTHLLSQLLTQAYGSIATGGNIGTGMLDLIAHTDHTAMALLELSSFQLDLVKTGAPDLAIITNIYPNHLDRHGTLANYTTAKARIYAQQTATQKLLLPYDLAYDLCKIYKPTSNLYLFADTRPTEIPNYCAAVFFLENSLIKYRDHAGERELLPLHTLPMITFAQNWLIIASAVHLLGIDMQFLINAAPTFSMPPHRLEYVGSAQGVTFYNDSKATTNSSMLAAVNTVSQQKPVHLFMGGLSKGVDREPAIKGLHKAVVHAYCFGKEAEKLHALCTKYGIASSQHRTLEDAFALCINKVNPGQAVLLSPGGASYDLFADYEQRGIRFVELVKQYLGA